MVSDILNFISLGRNLIHTINEVRGATASRSADSAQAAASGRIESLESKIADMESRSNQHHFRVVEVEQNLGKTLRATEALAHRVAAIFWMAAIACGFALAGVIVSVIALTRTIR